MTTTSSRPFIAAMQVTLDGYILGPAGEADWVDSWADGLDLLPEVDAFVLGGGLVYLTYEFARKASAVEHQQPLIAHRSQR